MTKLAKLIPFRQFRQILEGDERYLIPAVKHKGKIYKQEGSGHLEICKWNRLPEKESELGFKDHMGRFINRERAMEYARNNDLIDKEKETKWRKYTNPSELDTVMLKNDSMYYPKKKKNNWGTN